MARMYRAECLRDTVQDIPYQYFKKGMGPDDKDMRSPKTARW